ncbi:MAG: hypothetical protein A2Y73_00055 [Chloroflexi bacterium RBG_13_56_8]|nr:MAG: hypothetical protein A2Y73_00055 [Chloroflexi bacterium RBG_13_56_8]
MIVLIVPVAASLLLSLFRGGRFERLGEVRIKGFYLILLTLVLQVLLFNPFWSDAAVWSESLYILTTLPLVVATWLNRRVLGVIPVALGLLTNSLAMLTNDGYMPVSFDALYISGYANSPQAVGSVNLSLLRGMTPLWFLGDIFAVPKWVPMASVFSVGDVIIALGGAWFVWVGTRGPRARRVFP